MNDLVETAQPETQVSGGQDASLETTFSDITTSDPRTDAAAPAEQPKSLDQTLSDVFDRMNGRAPKEAPTASSVPTETAKAPEPPPAPETTAPAPSTWTQDLHGHWSKIPADTQKVLAEREGQFVQALQQQHQALQYFQPLQPVYDQLKAWGQSGREHEVIQSWARAQQILDTQPVEGIAWLIQNYKADPAAIMAKVGYQPQTANGQQASPVDDLFKDPRYDTIAQQQQQLTQQLQAAYAEIQRLGGSLTQQQQLEQQRAQAAHDAESRAIAEAIQKFSADKPYFKDVEADITHEIPFIRQREPHLTSEQILAKAYDRAVYANSQVREKVLADQRKAETEKAQKEAAAKATLAKKHSSMNVRTGASASTPTFDGRWDDPDKLSSLFDKIQAGR